MQFVLDVKVCNLPRIMHECRVQIRERRPLFNQMILNRYQPGQGLKPHTDLTRFADGICVVSLGSSAVLKFSTPDGSQLHRVLMDAGDLVMMHGPARWEWLHGISNAEQDAWHGGTLKLRTQRTSITFRAMAERVVEETAG
jgi:alkylated DNA repair dioxygenase AlkB